MTLKIGYEPIKGDPEDDSCDHSDNDDTQDEEEFSNPKSTEGRGLEYVEGLHMSQYFGKGRECVPRVTLPDIP